MKDLSNENIIHIKKDGIEYLQFRKLLEYQDILKHAYCIGLDKNFRTTDTNNISSPSYEKLGKTLNIKVENIVKPEQAHTDQVRKIDKIEDIKQYGKIDGLITDKKNIAISTTNADCILLLFFDPIKKVIANTHSGWRGTVQRISVETVRKMKEIYNSKPEDIICCMCPSIRKCHFDVREDVEEIFEEEFRDLQNMNLIIEKQINTDKWKIDTIEINKNILEAEGLKKENIIDSKICSVCNSDLIHSFRAEKLGYGLNTAIIELI